MLIQLETIDGRQVLINVDMISRVFPPHDKTLYPEGTISVLVTKDGGLFNVKETAAEIFYFSRHARN